MSNKPRIVIDSNVWLSGLIFGGSPGSILKLFSDGDVTVVVSEELLSELRRKIIEKFPLFIPQLSLLEASIRADESLVALGAVTVKVCRDLEDDKFLETALIGGCGYIVSGDKDLLALKTYESIRIVTPSDFLKAEEAVR